MSNAAGKCDENYYYSEFLGRCEHCGRLCDIPGLYGDTCRNKCPDYIPNGHVTTQLSLVTTSSSENVNWGSVLIKVSISFCAFLLLGVMIYFLWMKVLKRLWLSFVEHFQNRKLRPPVQEQNDNGLQIEMIPLTNHNLNTEDLGSVGSVVGDYADFINGKEANMPSLMSERDPIRIDLSNILYESLNEDSSGFSSVNFNFGETFPCHSLESLGSVFEYSDNQTRRKCMH